MYKIIIVALLVFLVPHSAEAIKLKYHKGIIFHDSANTSIITNYIEDVMFLLPPDMAKILTNEYQDLIKASTFTLPNNYFMRQVKSEQRVKEDYLRLASKYKVSRDGKDLAIGLGRSIFDIVEISMTTKNDPMNENLRRNLYDFLALGVNGEYCINYKFDKASNIDTAVSKICRTKTYNKKEAYTQLVMRTAELWTNVWRGIDNDIRVNNQYFVRIPWQIEIDRNPIIDIDELSSGEVRDVKEAWIVLNSYGSTDMESRMIKKRVNDYVQARVGKHVADREAYIANKSKNTPETVILINTEKLLDAVLLQQKIFDANNQKPGKLQ